jgi:hypothetical protein
MQGHALNPLQPPTFFLLSNAARGTQSAQVFMLRAANLNMETRLALLDEADREKALVFRREERPRSGACWQAACAGCSLLAARMQPAVWCSLN